MRSKIPIFWCEISSKIQVKDTKILRICIKKFCEYGPRALIFLLICRAPSDCRQYFTGPTGTFKSFNYGNGVQPASLNYYHCFRQEKGETKIFQE